jgi:uncharacterized surface protein with fasciclin (FAS1) repeats
VRGALTFRTSFGSSDLYGQLLLNKWFMHIKSFFSFCFRAFVLLFFSVFLLQNCSKTKTAYHSVTPNTTITYLVKNASKLTIYYKAITKTGLDTIFAAAGPYTVFVPSDAFFAAAGIDSNVINSYSGADLRNIILYQTIAGEGLLSANFPKGSNAAIIMANGDSAFISTDSAGFFLNGSRLTPLDVIASNGVIDGLEGVLMPASGTILQIVQADTALSFLAAAISRASQGSTKVDSLLAGNGPFTIFGPINSAFQASMGYSTLNAINNADPDTLARIITYHILAGRFFSPDLSHAGREITLSGDSLSTSLDFGNNVTIMGNRDSTAANLIVKNILARNGVLDKIDQVLLP